MTIPAEIHSNIFAPVTRTGVVLPARIRALHGGMSHVRFMREMVDDVLFHGQVSARKLRYHRRRCHGKTTAQRRKRRGWA